MKRPSIHARSFFLVLLLATFSLPAIGFSQSDPTLLGSAPTGQQPSSIAVSSNYAYVTNDVANVMQVFDVSDPTSPTLVDTVSAGQQPLAVYANYEQTYVYLVDGGNSSGSDEMRIYSTSNPAAPVLAGTVTAPDMSYPWTIFLQGNYAYVGDVGNNTVHVFDISDPTSAREVDTVSMDPSSGYDVFGMGEYIYGNYLYVADVPGNALEIFDISTPATPTFVGSVATDEHPWGVQVIGNDAYVSSVGDGDDTNIQVFDISNPTSPTLVDSAEIPVAINKVPQGGLAITSSISGTYLLVAPFDGSSLYEFDISNPAAISLIDTVPTSGYPLAIGMDEDYAYVSNESNLMQIFQTTDYPACYINISPNPSAYAASGDPVTVSWTTSNAPGGVYIHNIGSVGSSGSVNVPSQADTNYECFAYSDSDGNGHSTGSVTFAQLFVTPPAEPSVSITASSTEIFTNQPTNITADFAPGYNDELTGDNINGDSGNAVPWSGGQGATTDPDASKTIVFTPTEPGTYTFNAVAQTSYYTDWTTYASTKITVIAGTPPTATLEQSTATTTPNAPFTVTWNSSNTATCTLQDENPLGGTTDPWSTGTSGSKIAEPATVGTYHWWIDCTGSEGGTVHEDVYHAVACTPAYSCSGNEVQYTDASCTTTDVQMCASPGYCQDGVSSCQYPTILFNPLGNHTGHLQAISNIVLQGATTTVYWNVSDAQSCTVTGSNGDSWDSTSGSESTQPITSQTTYTLQCAAYGDNPSITETQTVNVTPKFTEH